MVIGKCPNVIVAGDKNEPIYPEIEKHHLNIQTPYWTDNSNAKEKISLTTSDLIRKLLTQRKLTKYHANDIISNRYSRKNGRRKIYKC